jgi:hypothetical protein
VLSRRSTAITGIHRRGSTETSRSTRLFQGSGPGASSSRRRRWAEGAEFGGFSSLSTETQPHEDRHSLPPLEVALAYRAESESRRVLGTSFTLKRAATGSSARSCLGLGGGSELEGREALEYLDGVSLPLRRAGVPGQDRDPPRKRRLEDRGGTLRPRESIFSCSVPIAHFGTSAFWMDERRSRSS